MQKAVALAILFSNSSIHYHAGQIKIEVACVQIFVKKHRLVYFFKIEQVKDRAWFVRRDNLELWRVDC